MSDIPETAQPDDGPPTAGPSEAPLPESKAEAQPEARPESGQPAPAGAPAVYAQFSVPEGTTLDASLLDRFGAFARGHNWSQEQAQQALDLHLEAAANQAQAQRRAWQRQQDDWASQLRNDREIGGAAFDRNVGTAVQAIERFGSPALKEALEASGLGNHPELVRFCYRVGRAIAEDRFAASGSGGGRRSAADVLYPNQSLKS